MGKRYQYIKDIKDALENNEIVPVPDSNYFVSRDGFAFFANLDSIDIIGSTKNVRDVRLHCRQKTHTVIFLARQRATGKKVIRIDLFSAIEDGFKIALSDDEKDSIYNRVEHDEQNRCGIEKSEMYRSGTIYLIENTINGKRYVGQTVRPVNVRISTHFSSAENRPEDDAHNSLLHKAIRKYGRESFQCSVVEANVPVDELDEKERFYIEKYQSMSYQHGYNLTTGGQSASRFARAMVSVDEIDMVRDAIRQSNDNFVLLSEQLGIPVAVLQTINRGICYYSPDLTYPLRSNDEINYEHITVTDKGIYDAIVNDIVSSSMKPTEIKEKYGISESTYGRINYGSLGYVKKYGKGTRIYPLRIFPTLSGQKYHDIVRDIIMTDDKLDDIATRYGVEKRSLSNISQGVSTIGADMSMSVGYFQYPLRHYQSVNRQIANEIGDDAFNPAYIAYEQLNRSTQRNFRGLLNTYRDGDDFNANLYGLVVNLDKYERYVEIKNKITASIIDTMDALQQLIDSGDAKEIGRFPNYYILRDGRVFTCRQRGNFVSKQRTLDKPKEMSIRKKPNQRPSVAMYGEDGKRHEVLIENLLKEFDS